MYKLILIFILWFLNLEISLGGIWLRPNSEGDYVFTFKNILPLLKSPFTNYYFWNINMWDINIVTFYGIFLSYIYIIKEFIYLLQ
jgi:hypothetical protein